MMLKDADARIHLYSIGVSDISSLLPVLLFQQVVSTNMICALTQQICTGLYKGSRELKSVQQI